MYLVRKMRLIVIGENKEDVNEKYKFIRDAQYAQYRGLNYMMGQVGALYYSCDRNISSDEFKTQYMEIFRASNQVVDGIEWGTGIDTRSLVGTRIKQDFSTALKRGLAKGEISLPNYKRSYPLLTKGRDIRFYTDYTEGELVHDMVLEPDFNLYIKWVHKIHFKVVLGNPYRSRFLREELWKVLCGEYKIAGSSLGFDKNGKLILNLSMDIPVNKEKKENMNNVLGVRLAYAKPVVAVVNSTGRCFMIGDGERLIGYRKKMRNNIRRVQQDVTLAAGGSGRAKKLAALNRFKDREANFAKTYNHQISRRIVEIAKNNGCSTIVLEDIGNIYDVDNIVLSNWGYYQLHQQIEYKAQMQDINVVKSQLVAEKQMQTMLETIELDKRDEFIAKSLSQIDIKQKKK